MCRDGLRSSPRSVLHRNIARAALQPVRDTRPLPQWTAFQVGPAPGFNLPGERRSTGCLTIRPCRYLWEQLSCSISKSWRLPCGSGLVSRWAAQQPQICASPQHCQGCFAARSRHKAAPTMDRISGRSGARVQPSGRTPEYWLFDDQALPVSVGATVLLNF
ncbi:hypothetical protein D9M71_702570 [compost metagenome]